MSDQAQQLHSIVSGRVQGVSFRYYTQVIANRLGIYGWVRNLPDGTVEVTAEGTRTQLDELLRFLQQGPSGARVTSVEFEWNDATGQFKDFRIVY